MGTGESGNYYTSKGSDSVHHKALIHSIDGEYTHDPKTGKPERLKSGGHGQSGIEIMSANDIEFNIVKTYENGVRVGNVPLHKQKRKQTGQAQTWFPEEWTTRDIVKAGEHVASLPSNKGAGDNDTMWGSYKGVAVGVKKTNGKIASIFPKEEQPDRKKRKKK